MTTEDLKLVDSWPILECDDSIVHWEGRFQRPDGTYVTRVWIEQYGIQCGGPHGSCIHRPREPGRLTALNFAE